MPFDGPDAYAETVRAAARALRPRVPLWPSEWAQERRILTGEGSANPGRWHNENVPFALKIMDALDERHPAWLVVYMASRQVVKSEVGMNWVGQIIDEQPAPTSVLFPGTNLGKSWARLRLNPMIAAIPSLRSKVPIGRRSDKGDTLMQKMFPNGHITIGSTYIPTDMSSRAIGKLIVDDSDRFQREEGDEGDWLEIALMGLATFGFRRKVYLNSSPGIESLSVINPWWLQSSQGHYHMPCVHCGAMQHLVWQQLKWADGRPQEAAYECSHCAKLIAEHHKTEMLATGEWRHDFPDREDAIIGFHANCLMTPQGLGYKWGEHAAAYDRSKRDPSKLKVFINTRLGETHADPYEKLDWELIHARREPFPLRELPRGVLLLTAGVDVQKDRLELQILGWSKPGRALTVDYRILEGDPTRTEVWHELDDILAGDFMSVDGVKMRLSLTLVDSGYLQEYVIGYTRTRKARGIYAAKGSAQFGRSAIGRPSYVDAKGKSSIRMDSRGARQYQIGVNALKEALYKKLQADGGMIKDEVSGQEYQIPPEGRHFRFSDQLPEEYFRQLCAEVYDPHKRRWVKTYERNEALDTMIYAMAAALHHDVAVDRLTEANWARLEQMYEPGGGRSRTDPPQPDPAPRRVSASGARRTGFGSEEWVL